MNCDVLLVVLVSTFPVPTHFCLLIVGFSLAHSELSTVFYEKLLLLTWG